MFLVYILFYVRFGRLVWSVRFLRLVVCYLGIRRRGFLERLKGVYVWGFFCSFVLVWF